MTKEELQDSNRAVEILKGMNGNARGLILIHIRNLLSEQQTKLATHSEAHQLYRAQGSVKAYQTIIELFD